MKASQRQIHMRLAWRAFAVAAPIACCSSAAAQEAAAQDDMLAIIPVNTPTAVEPEQVRRPELPGVQLEEVIVTSTKVEQRLRDIPASITSQSGESLEKRGAASAADILKTVPGANFTFTGDTPPRVTIRGISADVATGSTTGILFGDVSFTDTYVPFVALDPNPFDLQSVEVLKGPQGTLFGASALNGAVRYVPNKPVLGQWDVRYFGQYTDVSRGGQGSSYGGAINIPVGDDIAFRGVAFVRDQPGWIDNTQVGRRDANDLDQVGARGMLAWQPDAWDIGLMVAWQKTDANDTSAADNHDGDLKNDQRPRESFNDTEYQFTDLSVKRAFDWADVVSDSGYVVKDGHNFFDATARSVPGSPIPLTAQEYTAHSTTFSQELRLSSPKGNDSPWRWVGGGFYFNQHIRERLDVPVGDESLSFEQLVAILNLLSPGLGSSALSGSGQVDVASGDLDVTVKELAAFGEVTRTLFDDFELTLGGRFYKTESGGSNTQGGAVILALYQQQTRVLDTGVRENGFNPKASLVWHATDDVLAYAATSKGFRVGGVQPGLTTPLSVNQGPEAFKSDTIWNYEGGLRTQWFDNQLRLDLTGFYERWKSPQTAQGDASGLFVYIDNVGGVESTGVDASMELLVPFAPGLKLTLAGSYAKTETTTPYTAANGSIIPSGTAWALAPRWQTASTLSYLRPIGDWVTAATVTHTYLGGTVADIVRKRPIFGYQQWDAQLSVANPAIAWLPEMALTVNNLADERGVVNQFSSDVPTPGTAATEVYYIQPRSVILRLTGHFGN